MATSTAAALAALAPLTQRHHGVLTTRLARDVDVTRHVLARLAREGVLQRLYRGVYAVASHPRTWEQQAMAALLAAGPRAAISHLAAARLHRLPALPRSTPPIELTVPRGAHPRGDGPSVHQCDLFDPDQHTTKVGAFVVTTIAWTLVALGISVSVPRLQDIYDATFAAGRLRIDDVDDLLLRWWHHPGVRPSRAALAGILPEFRGTRSQAERRFLRILELAGLPLPEADVRVSVAGRRYYLDFAYRDLLVWIEIDVHPSHARALGQARDQAREEDIASLGWTPLRFDADQLFRHPDEVVRKVRAALRNATDARAADGSTHS